MAPIPKPRGQARRRAGQAQWRTLDAEGCQGEAPPLLGDDWLEETREWWSTIWHSPMAAAWDAADVDGLRRLARLRDRFSRGKASATALLAMQQLEDRYGLNPRARRVLRWEIKQGSDGTEPPQPARRPVTRLRAV